MISLRLLAVAVALCAPLRMSSAAADPHSQPTPAPGPVIRFKTPSVVRTTGGSAISIPPSTCRAEPAEQELDLRVKGLQDRTTRAEAENKELRKPGGGLWLAAGFALAGIIFGAVAF